MTTWVVGRGGLLGHAIATEAGDALDLGPVPWADLPGAQHALISQMDAFRTACGERPWLLAWAAGAAVVASGEVEGELVLLETLLHALRADPPPGPGAVFLASSAGGVYAGAAGAPFNASTTPVPVSAYGRLKLAQEHLAMDLVPEVAPLVIGRLANLYGSRQDRAKAQGLVTGVCAAALFRRPLNIYVPMQTQRDWIAVEDAARAAVALSRAARNTGSREPQVHVIAAGTPVTVGRLIRTVEGVTHRRVPVSFGTDPSAVHQAVDLRLRPGPDVLAAMGTPLPLASGVRRLADHLAASG